MLVFRGKYLGRVRDMCALFPTKRNSELGSVYFSRPLSFLKGRLCAVSHLRRRWIVVIFSKDIMINEINYAEIAHRILGKLKEIDVEKGESLQPFMEQFEHLRLRDGFMPDAYYTGEFHGGHYEFYARNKKISEPFIESGTLKDKNFFRSFHKRLKEKFGDKFSDETDDWGDIPTTKSVESPKGSDNYIEGQPIQKEVSPRTSRELIPSIFKYVVYALSEQSAWELFLLYEARWKMPLHWHAGYAHCTYIFERADLKKLVSKPIRHWNGKERVDITADVAAYLDDDSLLPCVTMLSENEALVRYSYWNEWRGLVSAEMKITKGNGVTTFTDAARKTLVEYDCGIMF